MVILCFFLTHKYIIADMNAMKSLMIYVFPAYYHLSISEIQFQNVVGG